MSNSLPSSQAPLDASLADRTRAYLDGSVAPPPIARLIGFRPVAADAGRAIFELDTDLERHANPMGTVHGGILCDLADAAMGFAYAGTLEEGETFTTLELMHDSTRCRGSGPLGCRPELIYSAPAPRPPGASGLFCTALRGAHQRRG